MGGFEGYKVKIFLSNFRGLSPKLHWDFLFEKKVTSPPEMDDPKGLQNQGILLLFFCGFKKCKWYFLSGRKMILPLGMNDFKGIENKALSSDFFVALKHFIGIFGKRHEFTNRGRCSFKGTQKTVFSSYFFCNFENFIGIFFSRKTLPTAPLGMAGLERTQNRGIFLSFSHGFENFHRDFLFRKNITAPLGTSGLKGTQNHGIFLSFS